AVASDANFYNANPGGSDPILEGLPCGVFGMQICTGAVVSASDAQRTASILFTTNKQPQIVWKNTPPGADTTGIFTAITGDSRIISNAITTGADAPKNYPDPTLHDSPRRPLFGLPQARRYFYMATIDGRQGGYSDGATDVQSALWMQEYGAADAINMDGGG